MSILSLHSDHAACGYQLIDHCCSISRKLTSPEVDARLLTDVMQELMFSAKLMFVRAGCNQDLALCDRSDHACAHTHTLSHSYILQIHCRSQRCSHKLTCCYVPCFMSRSTCSYISKVDVLKILVSANYKYIPSLDDILETSAVTRLRNQLLEAEYYQLAVEVRRFTLY